MIQPRTNLKILHHKNEAHESQSCLYSNGNE